MVIMRLRLARFPLVALSTFVAGVGAVTVAVAWSLKQELAEHAELAEQNAVRS